MPAAKLHPRIAAALEKDPGRPPVDIVALWLPRPPSMNNLFQNPSHRGPRVPSKQYAEWQQEAGHILNQQRPGRIVGSYRLHLIVGRNADPRAGQGDVFNFEKPVSDLLVKTGVVTDDSLALGGSLDRGDFVGVRVVVMALGPQAGD